MTAKPLHLDPEAAAAFMGEPVNVVKWAAETKAVYMMRKKIEGEVRDRIDRAMHLTCQAHPNLEGVYHVEGGKDPDGHTVDLSVAWGMRCTCGSHMMSFAYCKHLIRVDFENGETVYDRWPSFTGPGACFKPGIFTRAVQVDLENAAYRAAKDAQQGDGA
jgi:hypothetical protein